MTFMRLKELDWREPFPGYRAYFVHSETMTFAHWTIAPGALIPGHSHPHEQVSNVIDGQFELTIEGVTKILGPDDVAIIPPNASHSGKALTKCRIIDVFYPIREDYR